MTQFLEDDTAVSTSEMCPQIGRQYGIKNEAAFVLQCKSNGKLL